MINIIIKKIKNKARPPCLQHSCCPPATISVAIRAGRRGFVLLFAVTISAILLAISLGVSNIAFRELKFSSNARDANDAFFAADVGIECAFFHDRSDTNPKVFDNNSKKLKCNNLANINVDKDSNYQIWTFFVPYLGSTDTGCAIVKVDKTQTDSVTNINITSIQSRGYNSCICDGGVGNLNCDPAQNAVERYLESTY